MTSQLQKINLADWIGRRHKADCYIYENIFYLGNVPNDSELEYRVLWTTTKPNIILPEIASISVKSLGLGEGENVLLAYKMIQTSCESDTETDCNKNLDKYEIRFRYRGSGRICIRYTMKRSYTQKDEHRKDMALTWCLSLSPTLQDFTTAIIQSDYCPEK